MCPDNYLQISLTSVMTSMNVADSMCMHNAC